MPAAARERGTFRDLSVVVIGALAVCLLGLFLARAFQWVSPEVSHALIPALATSLVGVTVLLYVTADQLGRASLDGQISTLQREDSQLSNEHIKRLDALLEVGRMIGTHTDPKEALQGIVGMCLRNFECEQASIMLLNQATSELEVRHAAGHENVNSLLQARVRLGRGLSGWVAEKNRPLVLGNNIDIRRTSALESGAMLSAAMLVPVCIENRVVGVLNVGTRSPGIVFDAADLSALLVFAEYAGVCLRQAEQAKWLETRIATLRANDRPEKGSSSHRQEAAREPGSKA